MPTQETFKKLKKRRLMMQKRAAYGEVKLDSKSRAITPEILNDYANIFGCKPPKDPISLAASLAREQRYFENNLSAAETERFSNQTVVGIGQETRGRDKGCYPLVLNFLKKLSDGVLGLGFPGGRVRLGETPTVRLLKEYPEESGLIPEILNPDQTVAEHKVGESGHEFLAYEVRVIGGKPKPAFTKGEQIVTVVFVDEQTLEKVCRIDGGIRVKGFGVVGVLRSHREVFLEYLRKKQKKTMPNIVEEVANV